MRKYRKEIIILILQLLMFYLFPLTAGPTDAIGMVIIIIYATTILSIIIGAISENKIKYYYPLIISILFIPSVFIYYNETALVHAIWHFGDSLVGILIGAGIKNIVFKVKNSKIKKDKFRGDFK